MRPDRFDEAGGRTQPLKLVEQLAQHVQLVLRVDDEPKVGVAQQRCDTRAYYRSCRGTPRGA
jgi:hypothetical protein